MHAIIRNYTGAPGFADELSRHRPDIENLMRSVPGFLGYYLMKTSDGASTVTVCQSRTGCTESTLRAAEWIKKNLPDLHVSPPQIVDGTVLFHFEGTQGAGERPEQVPGVRH